MKKKLLFVLAVALVAVPAAGAGGWATVGLSSLPSGTPAGDPWSVDLTVLQHGRTPLEGIAPVLTIRNGDGETRSFTGTPTGKPGVYRLNVVFPSEGTWSYEVWDDFSQTHSFKPVEIGAPPAESFPYLPVGLAAALSLALAAATILYRRRSSAEPAPVTNLREAA